MRASSLAEQQWSFVAGPGPPRGRIEHSPVAKVHAGCRGGPFFISVVDGLRESVGARQRGIENAFARVLKQCSQFLQGEVPSPGGGNADVDFRKGRKRCVDDWEQWKRFLSPAELARRDVQRDGIRAVNYAIDVEEEGMHGRCPGKDCGVLAYS